MPEDRDFEETLRDLLKSPVKLTSNVAETVVDTAVDLLSLPFKLFK